MEFCKQDVQRYVDRLANRTDVWYKQLSSGAYAAQKPVEHGYEPVTVDLMSRHLDGKVTCGFPALDQNGRCKWAVWDCDNETAALDRLDVSTKKLGLLLLREGRRSGRQGHAWMFFDNPVPASTLLTFDTWLREQIGLSKSDVEFFPKQSSAPIGSQVRVPLGINRKPEACGARGWFVGPEQEVAAQLNWFLEQPLNDSSKLLLLVQEIEKHNQPEFDIVRLPDPRFGSFDIWEHVRLKNCRKVGAEFETQCPVCSSEGHDKARDNLHILGDDSFICMFDQPGRTHPRSKIIEKFTKSMRCPTFKEQIR